jgi:hypothetical protein
MSDAPPVINDPAALRRQYLNHEASIRSIGTLYCFGGVVSIIIGIVALFTTRQTALFRFLVGPLTILLGLAYWKLGVWLRDLDVRGRVPATILACIGLLGFPIGTLISAYIIYLLNSKKAAVVFSDEYSAVIDATPEIEYRTSWIIIAFVVLLSLCVIVALAAVVLGKH